MPFIIPANTLASGGFDVDNSLRFNSGSSDNLSGTLSSGSGSDVKGTISFWTKRSGLGANTAVICGKKGNTERVTIGFSSDDFFEIQFQDNTNAYNWRSTAVYRDVLAWYNFIIKLDTSNGTANSRARVFANNEEITSWGTREAVPQNLKIGFFNNNNIRLIGARGGSSTDKFYNGYIAEVVGINNALSDNTDFIEVDEDSGIIKPTNVSGLTFGTNGFYLESKAAGTGTNASGMGADTSGNTNHFTVNNLTAVDQSTDTCTNNFATWNPLDNFYQSNTYSEANLQVQTQSTSFTYNSATIGVSTGKWYWEVEYDAKSGGTDQPMIGITSTQPTANDNELGNFPNDFAWYTDNGTGYLSNDNTYSDESFNAYTVGDVISIALDLDNNKLYFAKNGTYEKSGDPTSGSTGTGAISITASASTPLGAYFPSVGDATNSQNATFKTNFGSPPFAISSGNADGDGFGNFEYAVPSGYFALCTKNLAEYG